MTERDHSTLLIELDAADAAFQQAEREYVALVRRGMTDDEAAEASRIDAASDARWDIEEAALVSGETRAVLAVLQRRERDGILTAWHELDAAIDAPPMACAAG